MQKLLIAALAAFGLAFAGAAAAQAPKDTKKTEAPKADAKKAEPAKKAEIDLNSASEAELASLKGIGEARAKAIVKGRPYKGKDDLVARKIIPQGVYNDIKDQIIAKQDTMAAAPKAEAKKADAKPAADAKKDEKKK